MRTSEWSMKCCSSVSTLHDTIFTQYILYLRLFINCNNSSLQDYTLNNFSLLSSMQPTMVILPHPPSTTIQPTCSREEVTWPICLWEPSAVGCIGWEACRKVAWREMGQDITQNNETNKIFFIINYEYMFMQISVGNTWWNMDAYTTEDCIHCLFSDLKSNHLRSSRILFILILDFDFLFFNLL